MKRRITKVLAAGLIAGLLAGCGAQTPAAKPGPETEQAEAEKPETDSSVEPETTEETAVIYCSAPLRMSDLFAKAMITRKICNCGRS